MIIMSIWLTLTLKKSVNRLKLCPKTFTHIGFYLVGHKRVLICFDQATEKLFLLATPAQSAWWV
jgi:hypothetical protein